jgi:hypothetical protein
MYTYRALRIYIYTAPFHSCVRVEINSIQFFLQLCARYSLSKPYIWRRLILTSSQRNMTRDVTLRALPTQENSYLAHRTTSNGKNKRKNVVGNLSSLQLTEFPFVTVELHAAESYLSSSGLFFLLGSVTLRTLAHFTRC